MVERNMDPSSDDDQYLVMNKEEEEGDDEMISYWSGITATGSLTRRGETSPMRARICMT